MILGFWIGRTRNEKYQASAATSEVIRMGWRKEREERLIRRIQDAKIPVERRQLWGKDRNVMHTNGVNDQARAVWSLIDRDRCLIVDSPGFKGVEERQTVYPTRYWHRLLVSEERKIHLMRFALWWPIFVSIPFIPLLVWIKLTPGQSVDAWTCIAAFTY